MFVVKRFDESNAIVKLTTRKFTGHAKIPLALSGIDPMYCVMLVTTPWLDGVGAVSSYPWQIAASIYSHSEWSQLFSINSQGLRASTVTCIAQFISRGTTTIFKVDCRAKQAMIMHGNNFPPINRAIDTFAKREPASRERESERASIEDNNQSSRTLLGEKKKLTTRMLAFRHVRGSPREWLRVPSWGFHPVLSFRSFLPLALNIRLKFHGD